MFTALAARVRRFGGFRRFSRLTGFAGVGVLAAGLLAALPAASANASGATGFVTFNDFLANTESANYATYGTASPAAATTGSPVHTAVAFDQMRSYILDLYHGVRVTHSYEYAGSYFDCVTTASQPSVQAAHLTTLASPPPALATPRTAAKITGKRAASPLTLGLHDAYGNAVACPAGSIPMQRVTLAQTTRFPTLSAFLAKEPDGSKPATDGVIPPGTAHRYAFGYQNLTNYGGNAWLNLWNPSGGFSISQEWYANGSGASTQTAEGGWINYPALFNTNDSVLFIYFTADDYSSTGCYNLDCSGFVQTNSSIALGTTWSNYSTNGGSQYGFSLQYQYYQGNWWLYVQGTALGYYPGSVYNGGAMASNAAVTEYGGESYTGGSDWPQMGSGQFASAGWEQAAFQNDIYYVDTSSNAYYSSLNTDETNPSCYTIAYTPSSSGGSWGTYFYFGGPGGDC